MSSVVLNQQNGSGQLSANSALIGTGGIFCNEGGSSVIQNLTATEAFTCAARFPEGAARNQASSWTTYASDFAGGGVNINQLQKYAYADPLVSGPSTVQEYENGSWQPIATAFVPPAVAIDTIFLNRPNFLTEPLNFGGAQRGTLTANAAAPVVVPAAGITANSYVRLMLVGGSAAAFTAGIAAPPTITIQVGATSAASTFTATGGETGAIYAWEILYA